MAAEPASGAGSRAGEEIDGVGEAVAEVRLAGSGAGRREVVVGPGEVGRENRPGFGVGKGEGFAVGGDGGGVVVRVLVAVEVEVDVDRDRTVEEVG